MADLLPSALPDRAVCERARISRDARFDGLFFTAVTSTGIYCRPVCPAPSPKPSNIVYHASAASAEAAGFRPCLRCRPELSPADGTWRRGDATLARALKLIDQGLLGEQSVAALADRIGIGQRQLRRIFIDRLGAAPLAVHATRRLLFAKQLLTETALPITEVALAAGFCSLRRFNTSFKNTYRMAPRDLRRQRALPPDDDVLTLRLGYRPPYDFAWMLGFLRSHALPGVEAVDAISYARTIAPVSEATVRDAPSWLRVSAWGDEAHALRLEIHAPAATRLPDIVHRVRRMFDLDADPASIAMAFSDDARLAALVARHPGLRLPVGWDGFEIAVRAILGQQVSVAAARTFAARAAMSFGTPFPIDAAVPTLTHVFPTATALADADPSAIGVTRTRAATLRTVARAVCDGTVDFNVDRTLDDHVARWTALPGIGPWTAHYIAIRALGHPDAFPADDLVLQKALTADGLRVSAKVLGSRAQAWRPWRSYATIHLWRDAMSTPASKSIRDAATLSASHGQDGQPAAASAPRTAGQRA